MNNDSSRSKDEHVTAKDIMATNLVTVRPDMDVFDAIELLLKNKVSGAPVVDENGQFIGVFSEKDCLSLLVNAVYDQHPTSKIYAFVVTQPHTVQEDTDLLTIAQIFLRHPFRRLPVLRDGKLVGQISRRDVLKAAHDIMAIAPEKENPLLYLSSLMERHEAPIP